MADDSPMELALDGEKEAVHLDDEAFVAENMGGKEASQSVPVISLESMPVGEKGGSPILEGGADNEEVTKDELDKDYRIIRADDRAPQEGMMFNSYEEVVNFYKRYALRMGFGVAVRKSSFTTDGLCRRLVLVCTKGGRGRANECYQSRPTAKTNCNATLIVKLWGDGLLHVVEAVLEHNHPLSPSAARSLRCYKKMSSGMAKDFLLRGGHENLQDGDKECINFAEGEHLKLGEGDNEAMHNFFSLMQTKNPNFFYLMDTDLDGHLRNLFWADARSRTEYQYFNDVIYFDTTYIKDRYDVPLVLFIGTNHHGQQVLMGCGLLSNENLENYVWLFKAWLTCMLERPPTTIITGYCNTIQGAISEVFPGVRYRISLWHIVDNIQQKLRGFANSDDIKNGLEKIAFNSLKVDEFEDNWKKLIEGYGLAGNELLISLYEIRQFWVPAFLKDAFWAGLPLDECNKCIDAFFDGYLYPKTSLKEYFSKYDIALRGKYELEVQADLETFNKSRVFVSKFAMEEQLSKLYTYNIFKKFQDELKATVHCHVSLLKVNGPVSMFQVKEYAYMGEIDKAENIDYEVLYNADDFQVQCICGSLQSRGILCKHALSIFKMQQVYEIPSSYIFGRWRKDFKHCHALTHPSKDVVGNNLTERFDYLSKRFLHLAEFGVVSDEKYQLVVKLINDVEKSLLDDNTFHGLKHRLCSFETRTNGTDENHVSSQFGAVCSSKDPNSMQVKRRGRPPKKRKEPDMERIFSSNNEKDSLGTSFVGSQSEVIQTASTASHLGAHIRTYGGVDLMEEVNPNELSFSGQFGAHTTNRQHVGSQSESHFGQQVLGSQSRMQWIYQQMLQEDQTPFSRKTG